MTVICSGSVLTRRDAYDSVPASVRPPVRPNRRLDALRDRSAGAKYFRFLPERADAPLSAPRVIGVGRSEILPGEPYPLRHHPKLYNYDWSLGRTLPEYQIVLLTGAAGEFESEATGRVSFHGDALIFLFPGMWHRFRPLPGSGWNERWVSLHGEPIRRRFAAAGLDESAPIATARQASLLRASFDALIDEIGSRVPSSGGVTALAYGLMDEAIRQATDVQVPLEERPMDMPSLQVDDEIVRQALEIIWNHEHNPPLGVNDVARQLPVTRRTLDRRFAEKLGRTVLDEITACRISRAKRLLADTDMPIKAVAYRSGFPSRERLRLAFLSHEGMPPSEYREAARKNRQAHDSP